jgi:hypothetical protein
VRWTNLRILPVEKESKSMMYEKNSIKKRLVELQRLKQSVKKCLPDSTGLEPHIGVVELI